MKKRIIIFISFCIMTSMHFAIGQCSFIISSKNAKCYGESSGTATAIPLTGLSPFSFNWSTTPSQDSATAINLSAGTYTVTVTDSVGCSNIDSVTIEQPDTLIATIIMSTDTLCQGYVAVLNALITGGTLPYFYLGIWGVFGPPPLYVTPDSTFTYPLTIADSNGCIASDNKTLYVVTCTEIDQYETDNSQIYVYPNPAFDHLTIEGFTDQTIAQMYDISGKLLLSKQLNTNQIDISSLAKGLYFIKLSTVEGSVVRKFVKE
jgi:hypothetical protein